MSVYTRVSHAELRPFLQRYDIGELVELNGINAGMENTNYFLDTTKGRYVLTLYETYSKQELPFFLDLMQHLSAREVKTLTPISDKKGALLNQLCGKPAVIIERLTGAALNQADVTEAHCSLIGAALARFHLAGQSYSPRRDNQNRCYYLSSEMVTSLQHALSIEDQQLIQQELTLHNSIDWSALPSGITHSDLFCDNSVFSQQDNKPILSGIIDLYLACYDAFIYDLAIVANDWCCHSNHHLDQQRMMTLLSAYNTVRNIEPIEKQAWVNMLRNGALRFWLIRLDNKLNPPAGEMVLVKNPDEYKFKLQACLADQQSIEQAIMSLN
jgi:homoserine kinase type II